MSESLSRLHTLLTLAAFLAALVSFSKNKEVNSFNRVGRAYIFTTIFACGTSLALLTSGGWAPFQMLSCFALLAMVIAMLGERARLFGTSSSDIAIKGYSSTVLFQLMALTSKFESPYTQMIYCLLLLTYVIGVPVQIRRHHALTGAQARHQPTSPTDVPPSRSTDQ